MPRPDPCRALARSERGPPTCGGGGGGGGQAQLEPQVGIEQGPVSGEQVGGATGREHRQRVDRLTQQVAHVTRQVCSGRRRATIDKRQKTIDKRQ